MGVRQRFMFCKVVQLAQGDFITMGLHGLVYDLLVAEFVEWLELVRSAVQQLTNQEKHGWRKAHTVCSYLYIIMASIHSVH